ncbi:hypothetical protein BLNAU_22707 [Blattamonas nauphoetae]|uniref:Uncharacterized protein n=1 Tax=Blattamonas nauphoetae TaxID=2049346 RepID=A0ABQ9WS94_9EUKA|nr:hypothetical protein BLNAU_22707 [Blattamonas nauphoetae]
MLKKCLARIPRVAKLNHNKHALLFQLSTSEKRMFAWEPWRMDLPPEIFLSINNTTIHDITYIFHYHLETLQQRPHKNGFRLDYPPLLVERPKQRAQNPSQRRQNLICEQHRVMIETKRGTSGRAAEAASGGCDDGEERAEQRRDLQFGQLVQFALSNFIPTNHIVHHLPQHHNPIHTFHHLSPVPLDVKIIYEVIKSNNERIAKSHDSSL